MNNNARSCGHYCSYIFIDQLIKQANYPKPTKP